jgi:VanZ family protein
LAGATLIAFSRLYLAAHYPSDVLGGIILGSAIGAAAYGFFVIEEPDKPAWRWLLWPQLALVFIATQMAYLGILPERLLDWPLSDKVLHFLLFGAIVFWLRMWIGERMVHWNTYSMPLVLLLAFTFALVDESLQYFSPLRTVNIADLLSNFAGMLFFWWMGGE